MAAWEQIDVVDGAVVVDGFDEGLSDWEVLSSVEEVVENLDSCGDVNELSDGAVAVAEGEGALSEIGESCTKSPEESSKIVVEGSVPVLQENFPSAIEASITHPNSSQTHEQPFARNASGNNGSSSSALSLSPTTLTPSSRTPSTQNMSSSQKSLHLKSGQKVVSEAHFHGTKERPQHNSSHRRGSGPQQHRYSSHSRRYGSRKDQDRPSCDWNFQRIFRDVHPQPFEILPSRITRSFPTPHDSSPSIAPQSPTMQHLDPSVSYHDLPFHGVPIQPKSTGGRHDDYPHYFYLRRLDRELQ